MILFIPLFCFGKHNFNSAKMFENIANVKLDH